MKKLKCKIFAARYVLTQTFVPLGQQYSLEQTVINFLETWSLPIQNFFLTFFRICCYATTVKEHKTCNLFLKKWIIVQLKKPFHYTISKHLLCLLNKNLSEGQVSTKLTINWYKRNNSKENQFSSTFFQEMTNITIRGANLKFRHNFTFARFIFSNNCLLNKFSLTKNNNRDILLHNISLTVQNEGQLYLYKHFCFNSKFRMSFTFFPTISLYIEVQWYKRYIQMHKLNIVTIYDKWISYKNIHAMTNHILLRFDAFTQNGIHILFYCYLM